MNLTDDEREAVVNWAEENETTNPIAAAFFALMSAKAGLDEAGKALDEECKGVTNDDDLSDEWCDAVDALEAINNAWFDARETLGRRCLTAISLMNKK